MRTNSAGQQATGFQDRRGPKGATFKVLGPSGVVDVMGSGAVGGLRASIFSQRTARPREVVHPDLISREGIVINSHFVDGAVDWWSNTGSSPRLIIWSDLDLVRGVKQEWNARREVLLAYQVPSRGHAIPRESETAQTTRRARTSFAGSFVWL